MNHVKAQGRGSRNGANAKKLLKKAIRSVFERLEDRRLLSGSIQLQSQPAGVWVDDNWSIAPGGDVGDAGLSLGDTVEESPGGAMHTFGMDAFSTIQDGVNAVSSGGAVVVQNGTYTERVAIGKSVTISGQSEPDVIIQAEA